MSLFRRIFAPGEALSGKKLRTVCFRASGILIFFFFLDLLTKELVIHFLPLWSRNVVIEGFFNLTHVLNQGAAWGIFSGRKWCLLAISAAAFAGCVLFFRKITGYYTERIYALALLCSGIFGNCYDRLFRGAVVDFLEFHVSRYYWPSFNVADSCICIGVAILVISSFLRPDEKKAAKS